MIDFLRNFLPWRKCPLLGSWVIDVDITSEKIRKSIKNEKLVEPKIHSLRLMQWDFSRAFTTIRNRSDLAKPLKTTSKHLYTWYQLDEEQVIISEIREDGRQQIYKVTLLDDQRFEYFDPMKGYPAIWKRVP